MAANAQAMATSFKKEILQGYHALGASYRTADFFYGAIYLANQSIGAATATYSATGEATGSGYTAGGKVLSAWNTVSTTGTSAFSTPTTALSWTGLTISSSFDCLLIYNQSQGNRAVGAFTFSAQTITAGTLTFTMPSNTSGSALLQIN